MENQNKIKIWLDSPWRIFFWEAFLFSLALTLGIASAFKINKLVARQEIFLPQISFWQFILYFLLATFFIFLLTFLRKFERGKGIIFKALFIFVTFSGGLIVISSLGIPDIPALILMLILIFSWLKIPSVLIHNLAMTLGIAGMGSTLGLSLSPLMVIVLLIIFSIYDFIAVYKTKHMIKMAKEMIEAGAILALICPQKISDFKSSLKEVRPGGKFLILGGGDVASPLLLAASLIPEGISNSLIVAFFALIGLSLSFLFFISQKVRQPIPALPPIALFSIIGFLITRIF